MKHLLEVIAKALVDQPDKVLSLIHIWEDFLITVPKMGYRLEVPR